MKRLLIGMLSIGLLLAMVTQYSYAQMCGAGHGPDGGFRQGQMPMMGRGGHDGMGMMKREHHFEKMIAALGLDEKQTEAVRAIRSRVAKETVRKRADLQVARIDLRDLMAKDQVDLATADALVKKMAGLQAEIRIAHIKSMQEVKGVLTPEQRKKFKELRARGPQTMERAEIEHDNPDSES